MIDQKKIVRTGQTATVGAVKQHWGPRPVGKCDCGKLVVALTSKTDESKWFLANTFPYKNGNGLFYIGSSIHKH